MSRNLQAIAALFNSPDFITLNRTFREPNIFKSIARTHTETWHSAFLGWLLHPGSSHQLGTYPLRRFISLLAINDLRAAQREIDLFQLSLLSDLSDVIAIPNEDARFEKPEIEGRFDVLVNGLKFPTEETINFKEISILVEMKVNSAISREQCAKYINYTARKALEGNLVIPVFVAPAKAFAGRRSIIDLLGSDAWIMVSFQELYNQVISDCLKHPDISNSGKTTLLEYVKNLTHKAEDDMPYIITDRERELVEKLFDENKEAIEIIYQILSEQHPDQVQALDIVSAADQKTFLAVQINTTEITGRSVPDFYYAVLEHLVDNKLVSGNDLPVATGPKRFLISNQPTHINGNPFERQISYQGIYMDTNKAPQQAKADLEKLLIKIKVPYKFL